MMGAATEKARLSTFSLVLGIDSCCEVGDLSCLGMLQKCRRQPHKVVDVLQSAICKSGQFEFDSVINWKPV